MGRLGQRTGLHPGRTPDRIVAILDANRPCTMTVDQLVYELEERFSVARSRATIERALFRLRDDGHIAMATELYDDYDYTWGDRSYTTRKRIVAGVT